MTRSRRLRSTARIIIRLRHFSFNRAGKESFAVAVGRSSAKTEGVNGKASAQSGFGRSLHGWDWHCVRESAGGFPILAVRQTRPRRVAVGPLAVSCAPEKDGSGFDRALRREGSTSRAGTRGQAENLSSTANSDSAVPACGADAGSASQSGHVLAGQLPPNRISPGSAAVALSPRAGLSKSGPGMSK